MVQTYMEYYSAVKRKAVLIHAVTWMNLKNNRLSKMSRHKRPNIVGFHLHEVPRIHKFIKTESRLGLL